MICFNTSGELDLETFQSTSRLGESSTQADLRTYFLTKKRQLVTRPARAPRFSQAFQVRLLHNDRGECRGVMKPLRHPKTHRQSSLSGLPRQLT